jgi:hypothetical protein
MSYNIPEKFGNIVEKNAFLNEITLSICRQFFNDQMLKNWAVRARKNTRHTLKNKKA